MACDCLYGCYLKRNYPYEFYTTLLKLYTEKANKEKIAAISNEMYRNLGITVTAGSFGQDNRDWYIDKEHKTISQNLSSVKFISNTAAKALYRISKNSYPFFVDLVRDMMFDTPIDARQIKVLITLGYFSKFGKSKKLLKLYDECVNSRYRISKGLKADTVEKRMAELRKLESEMEDEGLPLGEVLKAEKEYLGRCVSYDPSITGGNFFVEEVDSQYGVKLYLYNMKNGVTGMIKCTKPLFTSKPLEPGQCIIMHGWEKKQRYSYHDGQRTPIEGIQDLWIKDYDVQKGEAA